MSPMLETLLRSDDPKFKTGLDATVACYLTLKHADGLPLVEDLFLKKKQEEFTDIFSVVMALRFLGQEEHGPIPRDRLVHSMRLVLDHPRLADQAIMDLARWKDWTVMDRLVKLFTSADPETTTWVRIPVINYLRACPLPKAKAIYRGVAQDRSQGGAAIGDAVCRRARPGAECNDSTSR